MINDRTFGKTYLTKLEGRNNDVIILSDGRFLNGLFFYYELKTLVRAQESKGEKSIERMYVELKGFIIQSFISELLP